MPTSFAQRKGRDGDAGVGRLSIRGPVTGGRGRPYSSSIVDLDEYGYCEAEYFVSGRAATFAPAPGTTLGVDGHWNVVATDGADFTTRILVRRPSAERFNGTVVVEFMQEYFGTERDTNFRWNAETLMREGFAWVGASLHHESVDATGGQEVEYQGMKLRPGPAMIEWDADRYARLRFPSSDLCYDVLSQIGRAVGPVRDGAVDPLPGLKVHRVVAVGNTIAADRLQHYINGIHHRDSVFDGFLLQDVAESGVGLSGDVQSPAGLCLRTDINVPTIVLNTMTAAVQAVDQPEGPYLRFWEPAGSAHTTGAYMVRVAAATKRDLGVESPICPADYTNTFPLEYIAGAALVAVNRWAAERHPAPSFARLVRTGQPPAASEEVDEHGNALGGLRSPWVDVPIARYDWRGECLGDAGRTYPFTADQLTGLYGEPANYHRAFEMQARGAQERGVLLAQDAQQAISIARKVTW